MKKILLVAGGTGGHYFPAEALLEGLTENNYITNLITDKRCEQYISYPEFTKIIDTKKLSEILITLGSKRSCVNYNVL